MDGRLDERGGLFSSRLLGFGIDFFFWLAVDLGSFV